jgi:hypothetical protein
MDFHALFAPMAGDQWMCASDSPLAVTHSGTVRLFGGALVECGR